MLLSPLVSHAKVASDAWNVPTDPDVRKFVVLVSCRSEHADDIRVSTNLDDGPQLCGKRLEHDASWRLGCKLAFFKALALDDSPEVVKMSQQFNPGISVARSVRLAPTVHGKESEYTLGICSQLRRKPMKWELVDVQAPSFLKGFGKVLQANFN